MSLSTSKREENIKNLKTGTQQLLVIGGGITGAGIALEAASRGIQTVLIEKNDFAFGTSSKSTKLIHGGLRYLKQFQFRLVHEVGKERAIVFKNAPHLVRPEKMLLPIFQNGKFGKLSAGLGLRIYDILARVKKSERRKMLNAADTHKAEPLLDKTGLLGGGVYWEYQTDDARLTMEVIKAADKKGALCLNYVKAYGFLHDGKGKIVGIRAHDALNEENFDVYFKTVINATGPWVDELRKMDSDEKLVKRLHHTKGVHLVFDYEDFPISQAAYFDLPDGRMCFAIPREGRTYVGTTDTNYFDGLDHPPISENDVNYLIEGIRKVFPSIVLSIEKIQSSWSGIRPLIHQDGKKPSELSRRDEIFVSDSGMVSIAGGKLTGYRRMAEKAVNAAAKKLAKEDVRVTKKRGNTIDIRLGGGDFKSETHFEEEKFAQAMEWSGFGHDNSTFEKVWNRFGSNTPKVLKILQREFKSVKDLKKAALLAQLRYCMDEESVFTPMDFLIRRTGMLYFDRKRAKEVFGDVSSYLEKELKIDEEQVEKWKIEFNKRVYESSFFD